MAEDPVLSVAAAGVQRFRLRMLGCCGPAKVSLHVNTAEHYRQSHIRRDIIAKHQNRA